MGGRWKTYWYSDSSESKSTCSTPTSSRFSSTIDARSWSVASSTPRKNAGEVFGGMVTAQAGFLRVKFQKNRPGECVVVASVRKLGTVVVSKEERTPERREGGRSQARPSTSGCPAWASPPASCCSLPRCYSRHCRQIWGTSQRPSGPREVSAMRGTGTTNTHQERCCGRVLRAGCRMSPCRSNVK